MKYPKVAIVTPTILKDFKSLKRCINSVQNQTYVNIDHIIVVDGVFDPVNNNLHKDLIKKLDFPDNCSIIWTNKPKSNTWGAYPRQFFLDHCKQNNTSYDYIAHLDDDNYIFPEYVEEMVASIEGSNVDAAICKVYHHGPVSPQFFNNYEAVNTDPNIACVVSGDPPVKRNIDTLNAVISFEKMLEHGWVCKSDDDGYCNDGDTFEPLFKKIEHVFVDKILGIHY